jgi:PAS domain S-box-containing protein
MILEPPSWRFTAGNPAAVEMFGAKNEEELTACGPWDLSPERQPDGRASAEAAQEMIATAVREGSRFFEWRHRRIGGEVFSADVLLTRVKQGQEVILQATVRDISERKRAQHLLGERMKELGALYALAERAGKHGAFLDGLGEEFLNRIARGWQHSEICCVRLVVGDREFRTSNFVATGWLQSEPISVNGAVVGTLDVGYLEARPEEDEGPFLKEERDVIRALAEQVGRIMERERAEAAVRESNELFAAFVRHSPIHAYIKAVTPTESRVLQASDSFQEMIGLPGVDMQGKTMAELFPAEFAAKITADDWSIAAGGEVLTLDEDLNGRNYTSIKFPIVHEDKTFLAGYTIDITERKRAEKELARLNQHSALILSSAAEGILGLDLQGRHTFVNPAAAMMLGYEIEELLGQPSHSTWHHTRADGSHYPEEACEIRGATRDGMVHRASTEVFWRKDGTSFPVEFASTPIRREGELAGAVVTFTDITERKRAEDTLRDSEERYAAIFRGAAEGILVAELGAKRFIYANPSVCRMLGYSEEEMKCLGVQDIHPAESLEHVLGEFAAQARGEKSLAVELPCRRKDGSVIYADVTASGMVLSQMRCVVGFFSDVTERKRADAEHAKLAEQLRMSQRMEAIGSLAGGVAHDFNNLLSVILSYVEFAIEGVREGDPLKDDLLEVKKAGERAAALTRQLLAFSRKQVLQPVSLSLNQVAAGVEKMLQRILGEDIDLVLALAPDLGLTLADPGQLEQVVMNLVVNARDAMPEGGKLTIETSNVEVGEEHAARHVAVTPGSYVQLAVSDTGCGMDGQTRARIFEPFFTTKERGKGTGLGLSTVYGIVKQSGGNIWVYSEPGQGTTFKVYLPRDLSATTATASKPSTVPSRSTGTETILVVEDEEALRKVALRTLDAAGYTVLTAADGDTALLTSAQHAGDIHLLLTDVVMPRMGGRLLAQALSKVRPAIKVVYMSGYSDNAIVHHGVLDAGTHFLAKPFTSANLARKVREVLDG